MAGFKKRRNMKRKRTTKKRKRPAPRNFKAVRRQYTIGTDVQMVALTGLASDGKTFTLSSCPSYTQYTALFDQYRILGVRYEYISKGVTPTTSLADFIPMIHTVIDHDDSTPFTSMQECMDDRRVKSSQFPYGARHSVYVRPRTSFDAGNVANSAIAKWGLWLDCDTPQVLHYGLKTVFSGVIGSNITLSYDLKETWYLEFRHQI